MFFVVELVVVWLTYGRQAIGFLGRVFRRLYDTFVSEDVYRWLVDQIALVRTQMSDN